MWLGFMSALFVNSSNVKISRNPAGEQSFTFHFKFQINSPRPAKDTDAGLISETGEGRPSR